jgi:hypothetical protein
MDVSLESSSSYTSVTGSHKAIDLLQDSIWNSIINFNINKPTTLVFYKILALQRTV